MTNALGSAAAFIAALSLLAAAGHAQDPAHSTEKRMQQPGNGPDGKTRMAFMSLKTLRSIKRGRKYAKICSRSIASGRFLGRGMKCRRKMAPRFRCSSIGKNDRTRGQRGQKQMSELSRSWGSGSKTRSLPGCNVNCFAFSDTIFGCAAIQCQPQTLQADVMRARIGLCRCLAHRLLPES